jgi:ADP-heptose:LPS heptosyltransferase
MKKARHAGALPATIAALENGGRILVSRLRHLGDVVLTLPLLECLHESFPNAELHYLAEAVPLLAVREHPFVHRIWESPRTSFGMLTTAAQLRHQSFDLAIDLFANPRSALLLFASRARMRLGEDRRLRRHLYTQARHLRPGRTALQQHLAVLEDLGRDAVATRRPVLHLATAERQAGVALRRSLLPHQQVVLLHVDASNPSKEWPASQWLALARHLQQRDVGVMVSRAPGPALAHGALAAAAGPSEPAAFLPELPLRTLLGLVAACDAVVSVDGGVMHCAVALQVPTVALFGPTDASIWFPYEPFGPYHVLHLGAVGAQPQVRLQQAGCLRDIAVDPVAGKLDRLLQLSPSAGEAT